MRDDPGKSLTRGATELPANLLDARLAPAPEADDPAAATRISRVAQLSDRGDHQAAAQEAADLIEARIYDIRLIGFYLFGLFMQRGISYLPALLGRVGTLVADDLAALRPDRRKLQVVSSATAWLFETIAARLQFHTKQRDATWEGWRAASDGALIEAIASGCTRATLALEAAIDAPLAAGPLARIRRWTTDDLRRALARREATPERAAPVASEPPAGEPPDDEWPDEGPDGVPDLPADPPSGSAAYRARVGALPDRAGSPDDAVVVGSPALAALQAKLRGFQDLVARGELARAAVVASDVRAVLADFDPVAFFPSMFAAYFKTLHQVIGELTPYFSGEDDPSWQALDSYYRADIRAFLDD